MMMNEREGGWWEKVNRVVVELKFDDPLEIGLRVPLNFSAYLRY
jgi:hypothetical protein